MSYSQDYIACFILFIFNFYEETIMNDNEITINNITYVRKDTVLNTVLTEPAETLAEKFINEYVIVRCHDAGVHAGILKAHTGRQCVLAQSRRLWYWKPADNQKYLSGLAIAGADESSKFGAPLELLLLPEICEIILCTPKAANSIKNQKVDLKVDLVDD